MKTKFLDFESARMFARSLKLKTWKEWKNYCKKSRPHNIPYEPSQAYKDKWISYRDWLGTSSLFSEPARRYHVNENYFKKWSYDMAYILGFWFADGNIHRQCFSVTQHKKDKYILKDILNRMESNHVFRYHRNVCILSIYSKEIVEDIKKLGGKENKSLDIDFPCVPKKYLSSFVRGYFDGDGCAANTKKGVLISFTTGSKKFAYGLLNAIKDNACIMGNIQEDNRTQTNICGNACKTNGVVYRVGFSRNKSIMLRDFMYERGGMKLLRKYELLKSAGKIKILKTGFLSYEESRAIVISLGIRSANEWIDYCRSGLRPINIPYSPDRSYKNKGWVSWKEWLGYEKQKTKRG